MNLDPEVAIDLATFLLTLLQNLFVYRERIFKLCGKLFCSKSKRVIFCQNLINKRVQIYESLKFNVLNNKYGVLPLLPYFIG